MSLSKCASISSEQISNYKLVTGHWGSHLNSPIVRRFLRHLQNYKSIPEGWSLINHRTVSHAWDSMCVGVSACVRLKNQNLWSHIRSDSLANGRPHVSHQLEDELRDDRLNGRILSLSLSFLLKLSMESICFKRSLKFATELFICWHRTWISWNALWA